MFWVKQHKRHLLGAAMWVALGQLSVGCAADGVGESDDLEQNDEAEQGMDESASMTKVKTTTRVKIYTQNWCNGAQKELTVGYLGNLANVPGASGTNWDNVISSVKILRGYSIGLYADTAYTGSYVGYGNWEGSSQDWLCVNVTSGLGDAASSLQVKKI
jgi:hypothetical protein